MKSGIFKSFTAKLTFFLAVSFLTNLTPAVNAQTFSWAKQYNYGTGPFVGKTGALDALGNYFNAGKNFIVKHSPSGTLVWVKQFLNFTATNNAINSIAVDGAGNLVISGSYTGTYDFDPGPGVNNLASAGYADGFVVKLDAAGSFLWAGSIGGPGMDFVHAVTVDQIGNVLLTGKYGYMGAATSYADFDPGAGQYILNSAGNYDRFTEKLDGAGNFIWVNSGGGTMSDAGAQIACDQSNIVFVCSSNSGVGTVLEKFDPAGLLISLTHLLPVGPSIVDITIDPSGNLVTTGTFSGTYDFNPGPGVFNMTGPGMQDFFVWKLDNAANFLWAKRVIGGGTQASSSLDNDESGNVYVTGFYSGTGNHDFDPGPGTHNLNGSGMFILKLNSSGNFVWATPVAAANTFGYGVQASGNLVYTCTNFSGSVDFDPSKSKYTLNAANGPFVVRKLTQTVTLGRGEITLDQRPESNLLSVYPNPNNGSFILTLPKNEIIGEMIVNDLLGRSVHFTKFNASFGQLGINMGKQLPGVYFIRLKVTGEIQKLKMIIQ